MTNETEIQKIKKNGSLLALIPLFSTTLIREEMIKKKEWEKEKDQEKNE